MPYTSSDLLQNLAAMYWRPTLSASSPPPASRPSDGSKR